MIYSKFGSPLRLVSKHEACAGQLSIQATAGETQDLREYQVDEMKADGGRVEVDNAVAKLPWKVVLGKRSRRGQ
jgi:hypothetical protein